MAGIQYVMRFVMWELSVEGERIPSEVFQLDSFLRKIGKEHNNRLDALAGR
jgi:hypothetical protein